MNGIECFIKNEYSAGVVSWAISSFEAELCIINASDLEKAKSIIAKVNFDEPIETRWTCGKCGEENDGNFQVCWKCQSEIDGTQQSP